ncbi:leucyl/phenylalanyl-tRNA--protein transferase [Candidatus Venteria ishoeyi]|uniref:Leucyl/phenylalanyl-tRNA--protein transferase n=1 Tax=Candidatus Venteria ishoeyi TaxID=1899563 RepID=A0A1H6FAN1_9GAMM|nr:leucyl/phenylalanyl-tRNA--protein transferase [Candidatus Venteria ishoeyi]SEH06683.1 Leucyl/phenylalanyl-tRNA--protein transferase [Candidatus Venteria ishoeyi]
MQRPYLLSIDTPWHQFPPLDKALKYPDGLLAIGGDLHVQRLVHAYKQGIFPWYSDEQPILWWSPDPRMVLFPERLKVSRSLRKNIRNGGFSVTLNHAFLDVIAACALVAREEQEGTWITEEMMEAYYALHQQGIAHSVECWFEGRLVGGLYGLGLGRVFFGESMFSLMSNASKVAFSVFTRQLQAWNYALIDCQVHTTHLESLGAETIPRTLFRQLLDSHCEQDSCLSSAKKQLAMTSFFNHSSE